MKSTLGVAAIVVALTWFVGNYQYRRWREHLPDNLMQAAMKGDTSRVRYLIRSGANSNTHRGGRQMGSPLLYAAQQGHLETVKVLLAAGARLDENSLFAAIAGDNVEIAHVMVQYGADANPPMRPWDRVAYGGTPIEYASILNKPAMVRFLLQNGANPNSKEMHGSTILAEATTNSGPEVVRALVDAGADVNKRGNTGCTPLIAAAHKGNLIIIQLLLERGADVKLKGKDGRTAEQIAIQQKHFEAAALIRNWHKRL